MVVIVVTNIEGQIAVDAFQGAGPIQATRATRADATFDRIFGEMLDHMSRAAAGNLRFLILLCFPKTRDLAQPKVRGLNIDRHLADVMLHVWIVNLVLRSQIVESIVVRGFGGAEKSRRIVRNETGLPSFFQILAGITDQIHVGYEGAPEIHQIADRGAHPDRIPPGAVYFDSRVG